jgi:hypothetical protein
MTQAHPDPKAMTTFCQQVLPAMLREACQVDAAQAEAIGANVLIRAEAFAALDREAQAVLVAPFLEEVFDHEPDDAPLKLKGAVTIVVRNSLLEEAHVEGHVNAGGIQAMTVAAAAPLSHLLVARRRQPLPAAANSPFLDLQAKYPRAWACLSALAGVIGTGGRQGYRLPEAARPELPAATEQVEARPSKRDESAVVLSAIDPRFDAKLMAVLRLAVTNTGQPIFVTALSRFSRNSDKLLRIIEFLLAHQAEILTTNYLLRTRDVWARRGEFVKPDGDDEHAGLENTRGLAGAHRETARRLLADLKR